MANREPAPTGLSGDTELLLPHRRRYYQAERRFSPASPGTSPQSAGILEIPSSLIASGLIAELAPLTVAIVFVTQACVCDQHNDAARKRIENPLQRQTHALGFSHA